MKTPAYRQSPYFHFNVDGYDLMLKLDKKDKDRVYIRKEEKQKWEPYFWEAYADRNPETGLWNCTSEWDALREDDPSIFEGMEDLANSIAKFLNKNGVPF